MNSNRNEYYYELFSYMNSFSYMLYPAVSRITRLNNDYISSSTINNTRIKTNQ